MKSLIRNTRLSFALLLGLTAGTAALAQETDVIGQQNLQPLASPSVVIEALRAPVLHRNACDTAVKPGFAHCHAHIVLTRAGQMLAAATPSGFGPTDLRSAYAITNTGSRAIIAIVDAFGYPNAERDLGTYRAQFGLPACTTANGCFAKVNQNGVQGNYPKTDVGWSQETALDLDMVSAICPSCTILLVESNDSSLQNLATAVRTATNFGAHAISNSYGGGEAGTTGVEPAYNVNGIAITASSGDGGFGVEFPASSPHVTAVGGTSLRRSTAARGWSETAWNGAGSGCSTVYAKPVWQTDTGCRRRTVADVSAVADPNTGVAVFAPVSATQSAWTVFGGTSVSSPIIAAIYGVNGAAVNHGSDPYNNTNALNDVTSGSNGNCGGTYLCTARRGYDGPTGLGTPKGSSAF